MAIPNGRKTSSSSFNEIKNKKLELKVQNDLIIKIRNLQNEVNLEL